MEFATAVAKAAVKGDDLGDGEFGDAPRVGEGGIENRETSPGGIAEIQLVGSDAKTADGKQVGVAIEEVHGEP